MYRTHTTSQMCKRHMNKKSNIYFWEWWSINKPKQYLYISAVWGVTENTQVFSLVYYIMNTIFIYLVPFPVEWNFHPKSVHFPMEVYILYFVDLIFLHKHIVLNLWRYIYHLYPTAILWRSIKSRSSYILFDTKEHDVHKDKGHPTYSSVHKKIRGKLKY